MSAGQLDDLRVDISLGGPEELLTVELALDRRHAWADGRDGARRYRDAFPEAGPGELYELVEVLRPGSSDFTP